MSYSNFKKPDPVIEKIQLTDEQRQEIKDILEGKPSQALLEYWQRKGVRKNQRQFYRAPSISHRIHTVREKYFHGFCHICGSIPDYLMKYQLDGATLKEYYCEEHLQMAKNP
jgi:hypothetical protein